MQKTQAQNLVRDTLQNDFNKEKFLYFVKNLLNRVDDSKAFLARGYVPEAYTSYIKTYERLATYTDPIGSKVDILIVYLQKETSLERARTAQRNFVARYLKERNQKDAGLVAFVSPNLADWRFSLVKMEYKFTEDKSGKTKVKEEFTPAKRWSFLVGKNENSHTAQSRLAPIMEDDEANPTLKQLEDAFNIEKVTKEFFEKYREIFLRVHETLNDVISHHPNIKADFAEKNVNTVDFSKKLLGQIVFLYFLQKKGWFGVPMNKGWGDGNKKFLRTLFEEAAGKDKNYFNDYLEPLFYEALAKERDDDFYSRFECKIPFLNGGLFDPINNYDWVNTAIDLPNDIFSNTRKTKDGDIGDGILDIFDRYNFTVKEDEPLEKEVAVDPEMLGKVFENLLEVKDRKSKGTYYTPREIVHYMCEQSLVNYLSTELDGKVAKEDLEMLVKIGENVAEHEAIYVAKKKDNPDYEGPYDQILPESIEKFAKDIDQKLADIKVCDPAIGSGAFPVGMMNVIVKVRMVLSSYLKNKNRSLYNFKRDCIQNSLYGVDIDPGAVEIAKLRLWLSLIVDEDDIKQIKPLPNLDYKIMQGNSLLEEFEGIKLFDEKLLEAQIIDSRIFDPFNQKISSLQSELLKHYIKNSEWLKNKDADRPQEVRDLEGQLRELLKTKKLFKDKGFEQKDLFANAIESRQIHDELERLHKKFFEETNKNQKDTLKQQIEKLEWELIEATLKEQGKISALKKLQEFKRSNTKPFFLWKLNFAEVFEEKGGFDVVIANPPYVGESGNKEIFRPIAKGNLERFYKGKMDLFYFFFHLALNLGKPSSLCAFISTNYFITASGASNLRSDLRERAVINNLVNFNELRIFESALGQHNMITIFSKDLNKETSAHTCITRRSGLANGEILNKVFSGEDKDSDYYSVKQEQLYDGIENYIRLSGIGNTENPIEKVLEKMKEQGTILKDVCEINQGLVTGANKVSLKHIKKYKIEAGVGDGIFVLSKEEIKNLNLTKDEKRILRPWFKNSDVYRWSTNIDSSESVMYLGRSEKSIGSNMEGHLQRYIELLNHRREVENEVIKWWQLQWPREETIFDEAKIVAPYRSKTNTFGYNEVPWYAASDVYFLTQKDKQISLKYILGLLNSKLYRLWLYQRGKRKGEILELFYQPLSEIPVKKCLQDDQKPFIDLAEKILKITKSDDYLKNAEKRAIVQDLEHQIDKLVYKLYGLTENEIKIVEKEL
ncbi:MAG: TaqI-like C-terminal specificity domain-containing protein [Minisyncoccia bacterium]|jgi:hypothetical protein